jgi:hypothetical protein
MVKKPSELYVQYGCGWSAPSGWRNFDASPTLRFERIPIVGLLYTKNSQMFPNGVEYGDIVWGLPLKHNTCAGVYYSHVLEHLSLNDFRQALINTHQILQPNGVFRLVLPDLEQLIYEYSHNSNSDAALIFMRETSLGRENRPQNLKGFLADFIGNSMHLWMWDYKSLKVEIEAAGFVNIRKAVFNDSKDSRFLEVEDNTRWHNQLGIECSKKY